MNRSTPSRPCYKTATPFSRPPGVVCPSVRLPSHTFSSLAHLLFPRTPSLPSTYQNPESSPPYTYYDTNTEYTLLSKVNDRPEHAEELAALLKRFGMTDTRVGKMLPGRSMTQQQRMRGVERADETDRVDEEERFGGYHVNLIPYNPVDEGEYERPSRESVEKFAELLRRQGVNVTIRVTRGLEAAAACGQLRNQFQKQPAPLMETKAGAVATPAL